MFITLFFSHGTVVLFNMSMRHPGTTDGCCATVALVTGARVVIATLGDVAAVVCMRNGEAEEFAKAHVPNLEQQPSKSGPVAAIEVAPGLDSDDDDDDEDEEDLPNGASGMDQGHQEIGRCTDVCRFFDFLQSFGQEIHRQFSGRDRQTLGAMAIVGLGCWMVLASPTPRLGDSDFKKTDSSPRLLSTPEVKVTCCSALATASSYNFAS